MAEVDDVNFSWGKKKGRGGAKKEVQFYESFTYDGVEYCLYDSVYLYKEGEEDPYIGKLIKIWEPANKARKVKVLWFFHPSEILNYLADEKVLENELFLASGDGAGLANINPLEAIAGKCNVVCISKDERNRQPSAEELEMANYVFYRTFDVGSLTISEKLGEKIAAIEVGSLLNKKDVELPSQSPQYDVDSRNVMSVIEKPVISVKDVAREGNGTEHDGNIGSLAERSEGTNLRDVLKCPLETNDVSGPDDRGSLSIPAAKVLSVSGQKKKLKSPDFKQAYLSKEGIKDPTSSTVAADKGKSVVEKGYDGPTDAANKEKPIDSCITLEKGLSMKRKLDGLATPLSDDGKKLKLCEAVTPATDNARDGTAEAAVVVSDRDKALRPATAEASGKGKLAKELHGISNGHSAKLKYDGGEDNKSNDKLCKPSLKSPKGSEVKELVGTSNALSKKLKSNGVVEVKSDGKLSDRLPKKLKSDGMLKDKFNDKLHKAPIKQCKSVEVEAYGCVKEVVRRPRTDKEKYYTSIESRMKVAEDLRTLLLLQNLDPSYTSSEVEDIVWCAFGEPCSAKMIPSTAMSSPHSGQAFAIFKTPQAAEMVISKLHQGCLMLPNSRPLTAIPGSLHSPEKQSSFPGHLVIDKLKQQPQRELKAVSTSHSSQWNTLEYEMALEWRLLQDRSNLCWRKLYKQQGEDLRKLKKSFKPKK